MHKICNEKAARRESKLRLSAVGLFFVPRVETRFDRAGVVPDSHTVERPAGRIPFQGSEPAVFHAVTVDVPVQHPLCRADHEDLSSITPFSPRGRDGDLDTSRSIARLVDNCFP